MSKGDQESQADESGHDVEFTKEGCPSLDLLLLLPSEIQRKQEEVRQRAEVEEDDAEAEDLGAHSNDRLRVVIPLFVEVEDNLGVSIIDGNHRYDEVGEGGQVEDGEVRVALEAILR